MSANSGIVYYPGPVKPLAQSGPYPLGLGQIPKYLNRDHIFLEVQMEIVLGFKNFAEDSSY